ncbi:ferredoxin-thioredoxin reductase catalytic domain-containing protein [Methanobrevibacter sp. DSM 116169]|uniref:ferredoxin-thioredoxin reductase catalytic domain-containing protein n=1 Tax=Methanobrevibacter sp. DSM 116169 TaxID=3242727 RepID=UPI0038FCF503
MGEKYDKLKAESEQFGYYLNPDVDFVESLIDNIDVNKERYGYGACPCRLASGNKQKDLDLVCPCDYRDADLNDYGACFCALYVTKDVLDGKRELTSIPDRRIKELKKKKEDKEVKALANLKYPIYRCKVCGYLCSREDPPDQCPICNASKERFERIL